jgi:hypothetical protein
MALPGPSNGIVPYDYQSLSSHGRNGGAKDQEEMPGGSTDGLISHRMHPSQSGMDEPAARVFSDPVLEREEGAAGPNGIGWACDP